MNIVAFKLVTGEEVVADLVDKTSGSYRLAKPRTILISQGAKPGELVLNMIPWMVCAQDHGTGAEVDSFLDFTAIIGQPVKIPAGLEKGYLQRTTAIQLA